MKIAVVDTETTGLDPEKDKVVEFAATIIDVGKRKIVETFEAFCSPGQTPISIEARATHHITDEELEGAKDLSEVLADAPLDDVDFFCAHNAAFDRQFVKYGNDMKWLCTYRSAMHVWPDAPRHTNQILRYYLEGLNKKLYATKKGQEIMKLPPHRALPDTWVTAHILLALLEGKEPRDIHVLTNSPVLLKVCRFGKHAGTEWKKVPRDYLAWIIRTGDFDADVMHTARHYSGAR